MEIDYEKMYKNLKKTLSSKEYVRSFDANRRIAIPRKFLEILNIEYMKDYMELSIVDEKIVLEKIKYE